MSALINFSIDVTKLPKERFVKGKNGGIYLNVTASINNDVDNYGNNVSFFVSQSKEEREAKAKRTYIGNGKVAWTDGSIAKAEAVEVGETSTPVTPEPAEDFPF